MRHAGSLVVLAVALVSVFALLLFTNADGVPFRLIPWDFRSLLVPWVTYGWDVIKSGSLPLWCPYAGGGVPIFINPQTWIYSPLSLLFGPLFGFSFRQGQLITVLMMWIGGVGAYTLAFSILKTRTSALLTGLCFELSSVLFCHMEHLGILSAFSLTPWLFWVLFLSFERRSPWGPPLLAWFVYWLISGVYLGVIIILIPWSVGLVVALLMRRPMARTKLARILGINALAAVVGVAMSALTWLPFAMSTSEFARGKPLSVDAALSPSFSMAAKDLWGMLWSFTTQTPLPGSDLDISMRGMYFGAVALVLAASCLVYARGWILTPLIAVSLGSVLMILGSASFGRIFLHIVLPIFNLSRLPAADSRGLVLLGLGVLAGGGATMLARGDAPSLALVRKGLVGLFLFYLASLVGLPLIFGKPVEAQLSTVTFEAFCMLLALLALARTKGTKLVLLLAGVVWLETGYAAMKNFEPIGQPISKEDYAAISKHVTKFTVDEVNQPRLGDGANPVDQSSAEAFLAKKFHINDYNPLRLNRFVALLDAGFLPWLQTGPRVVALPTGAQPKNYTEFQAAVANVPFTIVEFTPNRVRYRVETANDALLVFNEIYFPGWNATVDGQPDTVLPLAKGLRSLDVNAGEHDIVFTFRPRLYFVALGIALAGFVAFLAWLLHLYLRHRRSPLPLDNGEPNDLFLAPQTNDSA